MTPTAETGFSATWAKRSAASWGSSGFLSPLTLSVVIPVYNEKNTIHEILRRVRAVPVKKQIIVVDDCSTDGTREILKEIEKQTQ